MYQVYHDEDDDDESNKVVVVVEAVLLAILLNLDDTMIHLMVRVENMFDDDFF
jgi:hypothetical protein